MNRQQPCYFLPRRECDIVISGYSVPFCVTTINRRHELEAKWVRVADHSNFDVVCRASPPRSNRVGGAPSRYLMPRLCTSA
ncbi:hypothetical protein HZ994_02115 [Akkermansiaceae bacterium]|nr:hypothetical protein HZ994_02115 [Akkermansiaceae bacterium]